MIPCFFEFALGINQHSMGSCHQKPVDLAIQSWQLHAHAHCKNMQHGFTSFYFWVFGLKWGWIRPLSLYNLCASCGMNNAAHFQHMEIKWMHGMYIYICMCVWYIYIYIISYKCNMWTKYYYISYVFLWQNFTIEEPILEWRCCDKRIVTSVH